YQCSPAPLPVLTMYAAWPLTCFSFSALSKPPFRPSTSTTSNLLLSTSTPWWSSYWFSKKGASESSRYASGVLFVCCVCCKCFAFGCFPAASHLSSSHVHLPFFIGYSGKIIQFALSASV